MNTQDESIRGEDARKLMDNPIYQEAMVKLRSAIVEKWRNAPIRDRDGMHELKLMDKILTDIEGYIRQIADTGKLADIQLAREIKLDKLKKAGIRA